MSTASSCNWRPNRAAEPTTKTHIFATTIQSPRFQVLVRVWLMENLHESLRVCQQGSDPGNFSQETTHSRNYLCRSKQSGEGGPL
eukprot:48991-Amphidinium_carterae.2